MEHRRAAQAVASLAGLMAVGLLGWGAFRILRAQMAPVNLVPHLENLVSLSLIAIVVATVGAALGSTPGQDEAPAKSKRARRRLSKAEAPVVPLPSGPAPARLGARLRPPGGVPIVLSARVQLIGSSPTAHVRVPVPGIAPQIARIEVRDDVMHLVPEAAAAGILFLDGDPVDSPKALADGQTIQVRAEGIGWEAVVAAGDGS